MKRFYAFLAFALGSLASVAQVPFQSYSFNEALQQAGKEGKYVLVLIDTKDCNQCNEVATKGFQDKSLSGSLQQFVNIRPKVGGDDWLQLTQQYEATGGTLFFNSNGVLLLKLSGSSTLGRFYNNAVVRALGNQSEIMNIESLTRSFSIDNSNIIVLQSLIQKRKELSLSTDSLLDIYVTMLPADSASSLTQLQYITRFSPILGSKADSMVRHNHDRFLEAWYRIQQSERVRINNSIIHKTRQRAINQKNQSLAIRAANFAGSVTNNAKEKPRLFTYHMMHYFQAVKDTNNYLNYAAMYCDRYLMTISVDSINSRDSLELKKRLLAVQPEMVKSDNSKTFTKTVEFRPSTQYYTLELNNAAWNYYTMAKNNSQLAKAVNWAKRANEFFENTEAMDTYARLLYKTGNQSEAINWQEKAVALSKKRGIGTEPLQRRLNDMKKGESNIDNY
jgi:hypothetical protein